MKTMNDENFLLDPNSMEMDPNCMCENNIFCSFDKLILRFKDIFEIIIMNDT